MNKRFWFFLAVLLTLLGFAACGQGPHADPSTGTVSLDLTKAGSSGETYCVKGDIVVTDANGKTSTISNKTCHPASLTMLLMPGTYTVDVPKPVCSVINVPDGKEFMGCTFNPPAKPFDIVVAKTTKVTLNFTFHFAQADDVEVVFGVGAGDFIIDADAGTTKYCGTIKEGDICEDGKSYCLDYNKSGSPQCYVLCDGASDCESGQYCQLVARAEGDGGEGGVFNIHRGQHISSLDEVPGVCIDTHGNGGEGGMTGTGGSTSGSGGTTSAGGTTSSGGTGGTTSGTGGSGGSVTPPDVGGTQTTIRWVLPTDDYLAGDVAVISSVVDWGVICTQENDTDPDPNVFECTLGLPPGTMEFDLAMADDQSPTGVIWYGEENYDQCGFEFGGDGAPQGTLTTKVDGHKLTMKLVPNPTWNDPRPDVPCDEGEMDTYNVRVVIPAP